MKNDKNQISITDKNITEFIDNFTNDLDMIINNYQSNTDNNKDINKNKLINKTKEILDGLFNRINTLKTENGKINEQYKKYKTNGEIKKKFLENQIKNLFKKDSQTRKLLKNKSNEIKKLNTDKTNLKTKYETEINKLKSENENLNIKNEILEKMNKNITSEINKLKELNIKYEETINELEKENNELNDLLIENQNELNNNNIKYKKKLDEMKKEIVDLNNELDEREQDFQKYKNKYEKEVKRSQKLELKIQELNSNKEQENDYLTEYEFKKKKIPTRINTENIRNTATNNDIEKIEKKFRYLYRTVENLSSRNQSKNSHNSAISNKEKNNVIDSNNSDNKIKSSKNNLYRNNTSAGFKHLLNKYKSGSKNEEINNNNYNEVLDENSTNMNSNLSIKLTPENYSFIKLYQLNNKLKWCLFKKNKNKTRSHIRRYSMGNDLLNSELDMYNYSDFIWMPYKTSKDFSEFKEISSFIDSYELNNDKKEENEELKLNIKNLENIISEKNKENNKLNNAISNLVIENKKYKNYNEKLKEENYKMKYEKSDKNFIGVSFIADDPESSKFLDDKCCEDILTGLDKNPNRNNPKKNNCYSDKLKNCIDLLMSKVIPTEDINNLMANILWQLGCSSEDINKLIGIHRGVINTIPSNKNK